MRTLTCLAAVWAGIGAWDFNAIAMGEPPVSGHHAPGVELLDAIMLKCLKEIGCSGATLTVARGDHTLYSRGYGWSDRGRKVPIHPDTPMSIGSCDKPLTAAMIRQLAQDGKLDLNASVLKLLKIRPAGQGRRSAGVEHHDQSSPRAQGGLAGRAVRTGVAGGKRQNVSDCGCIPAPLRHGAKARVGAWGEGGVRQLWL